jgi:hypothetical protein
LRTNSPHLSDWSTSTEFWALLEQDFPPRTGSEEAGSGRRLATIQPDLVGEAAIIEAFTGERSRELEADKAVRRAYTLTGEGAARVLIRMLQDFAYALEDESATEQENATARRIMGWLLKLAQAVEEPEHLFPSCPRYRRKPQYSASQGPS